MQSRAIKLSHERISKPTTDTKFIRQNLNLDFEQAMGGICGGSRVKPLQRFSKLAVVLWLQAIFFVPFLIMFLL